MGSCHVFISIAASQHWDLFQQAGGRLGSGGVKLSGVSKKREQRAFWPAEQRPRMSSSTPPAIMTTL